MAALAGYLLVHLTQHMLAPHFHFGEETHEVTESVGVSALVGTAAAHVRRRRGDRERPFT